MILEVVMVYCFQALRTLAWRGVLNKSKRGRVAKLFTLSICRFRRGIRDESGPAAKASSTVRWFISTSEWNLIWVLSSTVPLPRSRLTFSESWHDFISLVRKIWFSHQLSRFSLTQFDLDLTFDFRFTPALYKQFFRLSFQFDQSEFNFRSDSCARALIRVFVHVMWTLSKFSQSVSNKGNISHLLYFKKGLISITTLPSRGTRSPLVPSHYTDSITNYGPELEELAIDDLACRAIYVPGFEDNFISDFIYLQFALNWDFTLKFNQR